MVDTYGYVTEILGLSGGGNVITYLLDANFGNMPDASAPLTSPLTVDVGELTLVQIDGQFSISGGELVIPDQVTPAWGDLGFVSGVLSATHEAGIAVLSKYNISTTTIYIYHSIDVSAVPEIPDNSDAGMYLRLAEIQAAQQGIAAIVVGSFGVGIVSNIIVTRNLGAYLFNDNNLLWVNNTANDLNIRGQLATYDGASALSLFRAAALADNASYPVPALGTRDLDLSTPGTGTGTSSIAAPVDGNTFAHTNDFKYTVTVDVIPGAPNVQDWHRFFFISGVTYELNMRLKSDGLGAAGISLYDNATVLLGSTGGSALTAGDTITLQNIDGVVTLHINGSLGIATTTTIGTYDNPTGRISSSTSLYTYSNLEARTLDGVANVASSNHPSLGLATDVLPGPRAAGDTFTHEADAIVEWKLDALSSVSPVITRFRQQDILNRWQANVNNAGDFILLEVIGGGGNTRGSAPGVLSGNERLTVICNGSTITGYYTPLGGSPTLAWSYASATNFSTETGGEINSLGTGGEISDLITWPLNLANAPNTPGAANVNAAFNLMATP